MSEKFGVEGNVRFLSLAVHLDVRGETPNERELAFHKCDVCGMSKQMQCLSQLKDETYVACDNECDISAIQETRHICDV